MNLTELISPEDMATGCEVDNPYQLGADKGRSWNKFLPLMNDICDGDVHLAKHMVAGMILLDIAINHLGLQLIPKEESNGTRSR